MNIESSHLNSLDEAFFQEYAKKSHHIRANSFQKPGQSHSFVPPGPSASNHSCQQSDQLRSSSTASQRNNYQLYQFYHDEPPMEPGQRNEDDVERAHRNPQNSVHPLPAIPGQENSLAGPETTTPGSKFGSRKHIRGAKRQKLQHTPRKKTRSVTRTAPDPPSIISNQDESPVIDQNMLQQHPGRSQTVSPVDHVADPSFKPPNCSRKSRPIETTRSLRSATAGNAAKSKADPKSVPEPSPRRRPARTPRKKQKFHVGIDFGTTYSKIAYVRHDADRNDIPFVSGDVKNIENWPIHGLSGSHKQVHSLSWYPNLPRAQNFRPGQEYSGTPSESVSDSDSDAYSDAENDVEVVHFANVSNWSNDDASGQPRIQNIPNTGLDSEESPRYLWGNEVFYRLHKTATSRRVDRLMDRPKLFLLSSKHTKFGRDILRRRIDGLISSETITGNGSEAHRSMQDIRDVLMDFFVRLLLHTKQELKRLEGYTDDCSVSISWGVPVVFSGLAIRIIQGALSTAIQLTAFGALSHGCVDNLFLVNEPEAAALYLMKGKQELDIPLGATFIMLDCGGGTVDGSSHTLAGIAPVEINVIGEPTGDNCGAGFLNDKFFHHVLDRLKDEDYLDVNGETRHSIVWELIQHFEEYEKREINIYDNFNIVVKIPGLRSDESRGLTGANAKGFDKNQMILNCADLKAIFLPLFDRVWKVLLAQIEMVRSEGKEVHTVFLCGGFGANVGLQTHLQTCLSNLLDYDIEFVITPINESVTSIAAGVVLRSLEKQGGPRIATSSYGFLRHELYDSTLPGHRAAIQQIDPYDGRKVVTVIHYFMKRGMFLNPVHKFDPIECCHPYRLAINKFRCKEVLYVSDTDVESHYPPDHEKNKYAQVAGWVITKMNARDAIIKDPGPKRKGADRASPYYLATYNLVPIAEGRNLRYETEYIGEAGKVTNTGQVSIASAFRPGTN